MSWYVHLISLQTTQHGVFCLPLKDLGIAEQEADELLAFVNAFSKEDNITFKATSTVGVWQLNNPFQVSKKLETTPVSVIEKKPLRECMPTGEGAEQWKRWMSEIQMLLHDHPVSQKREQAGLPPLNAVWVCASKSRQNWAKAVLSKLGFC